MAAREITIAMTDEGRVPAASFEQLLADFERPVLRLCYRLLGNLADAQDAAQEVFMRAYSNRAKFGDGRDARGWLYQVAVNLCRDHHRRARPSLPLELYAEQRAAAPGPEQQAGDAERKRLLVEGLAGLAERERTAIVLREIEGLETQEVAAMMGVSVETVRSHCSLGRAKLKQWMEERTRP